MKTSICIPCYNAPDMMERLLKSTAAQTEKDYEICISDDSSNDETAETVRGMETLFPAGCIKYVHNEKPKGYITNWNAALNMAEGEYVKFMFHDDWFAEKDSLERFVRMLDEAPEAGLAFSGCHQVLLDTDEESLRCMGDRERYSETRDGFPSYARHADSDYAERVQEDIRRVFISNQIGAPSDIIFRRGDNSVQFEEEGKGYNSDHMFYYRLLKRNPKLVWTPDPLICIGVHAEQYTEVFSDIDERMYQSYRYIYVSCGLRESRECREHMTREFVIPYHKGFSEARELGIEPSLYMREWGRNAAATVRCFIGARLKRGK